MLLQMALFHSLHGWLSNIPLCIYIYTTSSLSIPLLPTSNLTAPLALRGFSSGANAEESAYQCRRHKRCGHVQSLGWEDPLGRAWQLTLFLHGESHRQRSLAGYGPQGRKQSDMTKVT